MQGSGLFERRREYTLGQKLLQVNWGLVVVVSVLAGVGVAMLYSAANGSLEPWASRQMVRFGVALCLLIAAALVDIRFWLRYAYVFYALAFAALVGVEVAGEIGMGAQRWIDLGMARIQPSEIMKVAVVLALARYFHVTPVEKVRKLHYLIVPALMAAAPAALVLRQPDLGTAVMVLLAGAAIFFCAGVRMWVFCAVILIALAALPIAWQSMHDYQQVRVLTFLDPESDPLGAGYHITQSKIAIGAGGLFGKGFLQGSQSHLNFLPERQTDFIFTMLAEEFGLVGGLAVIGLFTIMLIYGFAIAFRSRIHFGRLLALGLTTNLFVYVFINVAMVMGLIPVVGVPLPLISYGGTVMLSIMLSVGLIVSVYIHRDVKITQREPD
jgi:rod shape determining protein RodA